MYLETLPEIIYWDIPDGDGGIYATVRKIRELIDSGKRDPVLQQLAAALIQQAGPDLVQRSQVIVAWWQQHIRYERDEHFVRCGRNLFLAGRQPAGVACGPVEELHHARTILQLGRGDCDDFTIGLGVLHELADIETCLVIIAADPAQPREYSHIYQVARLGNWWRPMWTPVDAVNAAQPWGWEYPGPNRREVIC